MWEWVLSTSSPASRKKGGQSEYYYAKNDAVNNEDRQRPPAEVSQHEADRQTTRDRADDDTHDKSGAHPGR